MMLPARTPTRSPFYFVQSPPNTEVDKTGSGFSPFSSPEANHYHHNSVAESSSTPRSSRTLRNGYSSLQVHDLDHPLDKEDEMNGPDDRRRSKTRFYSCLLLTLTLGFTLFCLILWGVSKSFSPIVTVKEMVFESLNVQFGNDAAGVLTDMINLNSTVKISYKNPSTFFTFHVTSSPLHLSYSQLILASGQMEKFSQRRKSNSIIETNVLASHIPLYGSVPALYSQRVKPDQVVLHLNLTFTLRSRAYVLGRLVKTTFYSNIKCNVTFHGDELGKKLDLWNSCSDR